MDNRDDKAKSDNFKYVDIANCALFVCFTIVANVYSIYSYYCHAAEMIVEKSIFH